MVAPVDTPGPTSGYRCLLVIPCLDEQSHIGTLVDQFAAAADELDALLVVVDGGSTDRTLEIVATRAARHSRVVLIHNPRRIQSAGVNLAVERFGGTARFLVRIDAHAKYPDDYCRALVDEAVATGADSVVVPMRTEGSGLFQRAAAAAQNSRLGTGGAAHRVGGAGGWIDHGHHALMTVEAFRCVGGYDPTFSHNEDAELDFRLLQGGFRIWMTGRTAITYFPRRTPAALFRQYLGYGRGRARNALKHGLVPRLRQMVPLMVAPAVVASGFSVVHWTAAVPALLWAGSCLAGGAAVALRARDPGALLSGPAAMLMHLGWSTGFWLQLMRTGTGVGVKP